MSKLRLAQKLAEETGTGVRVAQRWIDDVGRTQARRSLRGLEDGGSRLLGSSWTAPALTGGALGGGYLAYRQQDVERARAIARDSESERHALKQIMESDLPPEMKQELARELFKDDDPDDGGGLPEKIRDALEGGLGGEIQQTIILAIVAIVLVQWLVTGGAVTAINSVAGDS